MTTKRTAKHSPKPKAPQPRPKAEQPKPTAKVHERPLTYIGKGYIITELDRQLHYALSEKGEVLSIDTSGPTYGVTRAVDGAVVLAPGQSQATIKTRARQIDPSIV
jgi:hypothetical protein